MIELLALLLAPKIAPITEPRYKINHCYTASSDYRPHLVKITEIDNGHYFYRIYYGISVYNNRDMGFGGEIANSFTTIENVYTKETKCP